MAEPRIDATGTPEGAGLFAHISGLLAAQLSYLKVRLQLAGIEAKEAGIHYGLILAFAVVALVAVVFGYLFLIIALVFLIALAFDSQSAWIWVMFGAALLHLGGAGALLYLAKGKLAEPMFAETLNEFKKDQRWLTSAKQN
jgi:uncharacterized membrane protein YqjE